MDGFGLIGAATVNSAGQVGTGPVRVFDVAIGNTTTATGTAMLFNGTGSAGYTPYILVPAGIGYLHSDIGYRFKDGCFCWANSCTATINYIQEF